MSGFSLNPGPVVEEVFRHIAVTRMADVAISNPALSVEAVGFVIWNDCWLGVLVAPWTINVMLLPREGGAWEPLPIGKYRFVPFPSGSFRFISGQEEGLGEYHACSMFSLVAQLRDQESARQTARAVLDGLLGAPLVPAVELVPEPRRPIAEIEANLAAPLSKRDFLRGKFLRRDR